MERLILEKKVSNDCHGMRFDSALALMFPSYSRAQLSKWAKEGFITLDGKTTKTTHKVKGIELVRFDCPLAPKTCLVPQDLDLDIHFEDDHLLIINKRANWVVHPGAGNPDGTIVNALLHHDNRLEKLPRAGIVHRLDKDTTGLLIVAKTLESYHMLVKQMQDRAIQRHYQAIIYGECHQKETFDTFMDRHPTVRTRMAVTKKGKTAITHIQPIETFLGVTHLDIKLETGRTHQIRVHLTHAGFPLIGDQTYHSKNHQKIAQAKINFDFKDFNRQALHAYQLRLNHPITHESLVFTQPLPEDMQQLLKKITELSDIDEMR